LFRIDNKKGLLKQDTINQSIDVTNNANWALLAKPSKRLYVEVPAAPNNNAYTVVHSHTLYGAKLGYIIGLILSFNSGYVLTAIIPVHNNIVKSITISVRALGTKPDNVECNCSNSLVILVAILRVIINFSLIASTIRWASTDVGSVCLIGIAESFAAKNIKTFEKKTY